jgi:hypothetical protein
VAITRTSLTSNATTADATSFTTASIGPSQSRLIIAAYMSINLSAGVTPTTPTVTGNSLTWIEVDSFLFTTGSDRAKLWVFAADTGSSPTTSVITFDHAGQTQEGAGWSVFQLAGTDVSNGVAHAFVQFVHTTANSTGTSLSVSLAAGGSQNSPFIATSHLSFGGTSPRTNWTEIHDVSAWPVSGSTAGGVVQTQERLDAFETTASASWTNSGSYGAIAFEVRATQTVTFGTLDNSAAVFTPQPININIAQALIDQSSAMFTPVARYDREIHPDIIDNSAQPKTLPFVANRSFTHNLLDQSAATFTPDYIAEIKVIQAGDLDQSATTITPQVNRTVTVGLLDQSAATLTGPLAAPGTRVPFSDLSTVRGRARVRAAPSITRGSMKLRGSRGHSRTRGDFRVRGADQRDRVQVQVTPDLIDNSATLFAFGVNSSSILMSFIDQSATTVTPEQATFKPAFPLIDNSAEVYSPAPGGLITAPLIDNSAAVYAPTMNDQFVQLSNLEGFLDNSAVAFGLKLNRTIYPSLIDQSATTTAPLVTPTYTVSLDDLLDNSAVAFAPDLAPIIFGLIDQSATTFQPDSVSIPFLQLIRFDNDDAFFLDNSADTFAPEDVQVAPARFVFPDLIDQSATPIAPVVFVPVPGSILLRGHYKFTIGNKGHYKVYIRKKGEYIT